MIVKKFLKAIVKCKFSKLQKLAILLAYISEFYPIFGMKIIDDLFDQIQQ